MRILLISILSALLLSASNISHQVKILEKVVSEISIDKRMVIWSDNREIIFELERNNKFLTTENCQDATLIILKDKKNLLKICSDIPIFVLNYKLLSELPQSFGALFWKKGRPNIVIVEPRIKAQNIKASNNLRPYLEEKVW